MTFPTAAISTGINEGSSGTSHIVQVPAVVAGDRLVVPAVDDQTATWTWPASWVSFITKGANGSTVEAEGRYYDVLGSEGWAAGGTFTITTDVAQAMSAPVVKLTHGTFDVAAAPEASTYTTGSSVSPDAAAVIPSWGSADTMWIAWCGFDDGSGTTAVSGYPTNYTDNQAAANGGFAGGVGFGIATRSLTATTDDPSAFTIPTEQWLATLIAIKPGAAALPNNYTIAGINGIRHTLG